MAPNSCSAGERTLSVGDYFYTSPGGVNDVAALAETFLLQFQPESLEYV
ncbi:MAG: hypothetical protein ACRDRL_00175 [Sciscionella sp.]